MRRWSEIAERVAATTKTSEKTAILAAYLATLTPDELPVAAVFLTGRPFPETDQRTIGVGWSGMSGRGPAGGGRRRRRAAPGVRPVERRRARGRGRARGGRPRARRPTASRRCSRRATRSCRSRRPRAPRPRPSCSRRSCVVPGRGPRPRSSRSCRGELRIGLREGLLEAALAKAFDRPLDAVKRAGMLTGDIGLTAVLAREDRLGDAAMTLFHPLKFMLASPAEDAAEIVRRLGPTVWVEDKYDGIRVPAPPARRRGPALLARPQRHQRAVPRGRRGRARLPWAGILDGEILAVSRRRRPAVPPAPGAARAQEPVGEDPRGDPGHLRRVGRARDGPRPGRGRHAAARAAAHRASGGARGAGPADGRGRRPVRAQPPRVGGLGRRARVRVRGGAGAAQRGAAGQGPDERLLPGPPGARLAEDEEGARDDRLRGGGRRGGPRQAPRRPVRLHVRGPGRGVGPARDHRQGLLAG